MDEMALVPLNAVIATTNRAMELSQQNGIGSRAIPITGCGRELMAGEAAKQVVFIYCGPGTLANTYYPPGAPRRAPRK